VTFICENTLCGRTSSNKRAMPFCSKLCQHEHLRHTGVEPLGEYEFWCAKCGRLSGSPYKPFCFKCKSTRVRFSEAERLSVYDKYDWKCYFCKKRVTRKNSDLHHIVPLAAGGKDEINNLTPAHSTCNRDEGAGFFGIKISANLKDLRLEISDVGFHPDNPDSPDVKR
jgi:hypothetical protein